MSNLWQLLTLPPVFKGLVAMAVAGVSFPACGVMVLRLNLIPIRYMLMHGVILGAALALAFSLPLVPLTVAVNGVLVAVLIAVTKDPGQGFGLGSAVAMVLSMALASILVQMRNVPVNDLMGMLWGSPFAVSFFDLGALAFAGIAFFIYLRVNFRKILALFYDQEVAVSLGIHVRFHQTVIIFFIALTVALAMKILGALLIDGLLVLPVLLATQLGLRENNQGMGKLFITSSAAGFVLAVAGFLIAVVLNLPPSGAIALLAGGLYLVIRLFSKEKKK